MSTPNDNPAPSAPRRRFRTRARPAQAHLLGVVFQKTDGHARVTQGEKFTLLGGNEETHEAVTESVVKTFEDLKRKGRSLESADPRELGELLKKNFPKV